MKIYCERCFRKYNNTMAKWKAYTFHFTTEQYFLCSKCNKLFEDKIEHLFKKFTLLPTLPKKKKKGKKKIKKNII